VTIVINERVGEELKGHEKSMPECVAPFKQTKIIFDSSVQDQYLVSNLFSEITSSIEHCYW
jgi:hypothetical protein